MDYDARTENLTPLVVRCFPMQDRQGRAVLVAIAKASFAVSSAGVARLAHPAVPIRLADEYHEGSPFAAVKYPSDCVPDKPGTDVVVIGTALPPEGRAVTDMAVSVRVGRVAKALRVFGTRVYQRSLLGNVEPGPAQRLGPTPLRYELAFGGTDESDPRAPAQDRRNPAGTGFSAVRKRQIGAVAPRIEIAPGLVEGGREPAGLGAIAPHWAPRAEMLGTRDAAWARTRAPVAPLDFDPRHHCCAHPDLQSSAPLRPDEPVEIVGMTPEGAWRFRLPAVEPLFGSTLKGELRAHETHLDTFLVDTDLRRVELVWRVAIPIPKKAQLLERVIVRATGELPPSIREAPEAAA